MTYTIEPKSSLISNTIQTELTRTIRAEHNPLYANVDTSKLYKNIGVNVEPGSTVDEQIKAANLDWQVQTSPISYGENRRHSSDYRMAIYRSDTGDLLDTGSKNWTPFQNKEIVETFNRFCDENELAIDHLGFLDSGRTIFATANLNENFELIDGDKVVGKILLTNYHKTGYGLRVDLMAVRLICTNGLTSTVRANGKVISHVGGYNQDRVQKLLEAAKTNFREFNHQAEQLTQVPISDAEAVLLLIKQFGSPELPFEEQPKLVQLCFKLFKGQGVGSHMLSAYGTAWGLVQASVEAINHHSTVRGGMATHLNSLWLGSKGRQQNNFLQQVVSIYNS